MLVMVSDGHSTRTLRLFFFQAKDGIRARNVTGVQTCALPISRSPGAGRGDQRPPRRADAGRQLTALKASSSPARSSATKAAAPSGPAPSSNRRTSAEPKIGRASGREGGEGAVGGGGVGQR